MFNRTRDLKHKLFDAELSNDSLKIQIETLKSELQILRDTEKNMVRSAKVVIDFDVMPVFSIERCWQENRSRTCIGFKENDDKHFEWYLDCNDQIHEELCNTFMEWKKKKCLTSG